MIYKIVKFLFVFLSFLVIGGLWCSYTEQEIWYDFANYHYYNAWAFINQKTFINIAPAGVRSFFNPLADLYTYWIIYLFNDTPKLVFFCQGLWSGFLGFLLYKTILFILPHQKTEDKLACFVAFSFSILGYATFRQMGTSTNEILIACIFMLGFYLLLQCIMEKLNIQKLIWAGLFLGVSAGLKLTIVPFVASVGLSLLFFYKHPIKSISFYLILGISIFGGYLITNGFWMILLYHHFQNPFFPFFNSIFKSAYAMPISITDPQFLPKTISEFILFPFKLAQHNLIGVDNPANNFNILFGLVGSIILLLKSKSSIILKYLSTFFILGYLLWVLTTSVVRYTIPLECMSGILIVAICMKYQKWIKILFLLFVLWCNIYAATHYIRWSGVPRKDTYLKTTPIQLSDSTVLISFGQVTSFYLPAIKGGKLAAGFLQRWSESMPETEVSASGSLQKLFIPYVLDKNNRFAVILNYNTDMTPILNNIYPHVIKGIYPKVNQNGIIEGVPFDELQQYLENLGIKISITSIEKT